MLCVVFVFVLASQGGVDGHERSQELTRGGAEGGADFQAEGACVRVFVACFLRRSHERASHHALPRSVVALPALRCVFPELCVLGWVRACFVGE